MSLRQVTATLVTRTARHLLAFACDAGAPALAHFLLPSASVGCRSAAEVVAAVDGVEAQGGSTLLHRAARSGSGPLLRGLLAWGSTNGYRWKVQHLKIRHGGISMNWSPVQRADIRHS